MGSLGSGVLTLLAFVLASGTALAVVDPNYRRDRHGELLLLVAGGLLGAWVPPNRSAISHSAHDKGDKPTE